LVECDVRLDGRQVVVYCATGGRPAMAAAVLQMMSFRNVLSLDAGFGRWVSEGMPDKLGPRA